MSQAKTALPLTERQEQSLRRLAAGMEDCPVTTVQIEASSEMFQNDSEALAFASILSSARPGLLVTVVVLDEEGHNCWLNCRNGDTAFVLRKEKAS